MRTLLLLSALGLAACVPKVPPPVAPIHDDPLQEQLFAADRAFARAVADSGLPAWTARLAPDAATQGNGGLILLRGIEPVTGSLKPTFADASQLLTWEPTDAVSYSDHRTGLTVGRYAVVRARARTDTLARGHYMTLWRKQSNGQWKILFDSGWPDK